MLAAHNPRHVTVRTSWVYAPTGNNFVKTIARLASERPALTVVADQHGCPTSAQDLAAGIVQLVQLIEAGWADWGPLHIASPEPTTWFDVARHVVEATGNAARCVVHPTTTADYGSPAPRPLRSALSTAKAAGLGITLDSWRPAVDRVLDELGLLGAAP